MTLLYRQVDAAFLPEDAVIFGDYTHKLKKVNSHPISCAKAGSSSMMRKDKVAKYAWMEEGLKIIRQNGLYDMVCRIAEVGM